MNKLLLPQDIVGGSFWLISVAMIGAAIFFFLERGRLSNRWGTAMNLVGVIALMSSIHYFYAKNSIFFYIYILVVDLILKIFIYRVKKLIFSKIQSTLDLF